MARPLPLHLARYENAASRYLTIDGRRVHYRDEGTGPTLVLLHGVLASLHTWDGWVEELKRSYRIIRFDLPGFGFSDDLDGTDYTPDAAAALFEKIRRKLGLEHFYLAGNSLGGFMSWYYAAHYPEQVDKLILISPIAYPQTLPSVIDFVSLPVIGEFAHVITPRALIERNVRMVYGDASAIEAGVVERYYHLLMHGNNRRAMVRTFRSLKAFNADPSIAPKVARVRAPTLLMWGEADRWVPPSLIPHWQRDIPGLQVKRYPGLGHIAMEEEPVLTARDAHAFLSQSEG